MAAAATHRVSPVQSEKCRDARQDVVIESGLQGHADVFSGGQTASSWATSSTSSFVLPPAEQVAVFVARAGEAASLTRPELSVSDPSLLTVELTERKNEGGMSTGADTNAVVFVSKHTCKKAGTATVTISLPLRKAEAASMVDQLCPGSLAPVVFSYKKACAPPSHVLGNFMIALTAKLPPQDKLLALHGRSADGAPWHGIIPSGGVRTVVIIMLLLGFGVVMYEFGTYWFSQKIKKMILEMGPVMFGCEANIDHVSLSFWCGHITYTIQGLRFANPEGVECSKPYFMKIDEVKVWFNVYKLFTTFGRELEIRQLVARHIQANVEVDGYVYGESNISKVMGQMEKNNKVFVADLARIKENHGIDAAQMWSNFETWMKGVAERITLQEVLMEGIGYSFSNKALGMEVAIADMEFHDFSAQHDAVGMSKISYYLTHAVLEGMAEDIAGVEFGHGRFEGVVNSIKRWTS